LPQRVERNLTGQSAMLALLERASADAPDDLAAVRRYANACVHVGDTARAVPALQRLTAAVPDDADAWAVQSRMLAVANRAREAVEAAERAVRLRPDCSIFLADLGFALRVVGEHARADGVFMRAAELDPSNAHAQRGRGQALIRAADGPALLEHCHAAFELLGPSSWLIAQYLVALSLLGRRVAVAQLLDYDRLLLEREIPAPAGFGSIDEFNAALRDEMYQLGGMASGQEPNDIVYHGTRIKGGLQGAIDRLGPGRAPASAALLREYDRRAEEYAEALEDCLQRRARPSEMTITTEAIVTRRGSAVTRHTHACSWLSGVYYVAVPEGTGDDGPGGCMEFGPPTHKAAVPDGVWPTRLLKPRPGLMALFPGYFYHHVYANELAGERIAITYDAVPPMAIRRRGVRHETWLSDLVQE
jgi:tetratricopeptide (TPR) repeat protein